MTHDTLSLFLHQLSLSADAARWEGAGDGDLLEGYGRHGEEAAFAELMRRHGPMVLAACRRVLGPSPAELGLPAGSMARHLEHARELLRRRLARRGVTVPAVVLAALLAETARGANLPAVVLVHTLAAVRAVAAGSLQTLSPRVAAL